jgi:hypothetical protein
VADGATRGDESFSHLSAVAGVACLDGVQFAWDCSGEVRRTSSQWIPWELVVIYPLQLSFRMATASI